jgi:hypothetical protein
MSNSLLSMRSMRGKWYTFRHLFFKPPGLLCRLRLYAAFRRFSREWAATEDFELKIRDVCAGPDNAKIPRVPDAGKVIDGYLIMHNGIKIVPDSYTGAGMTKLLQDNGGVHEPQEEFAFGQVLNWLRERGSSSYTMVELGSYWAFYSVWFQSMLSGGDCFCVEPLKENMEFGRKNFSANGRTGDFTQAYIGATPLGGEPPTISVDSLIRDKGIEHIDILHADIQGYELEMLQGATEAFGRKMIDYVFVSTHHNFLHYRCMEELEKHGFKILAEADLLETYSTDGVIIAGRLGLPHLETINITPRG